MNYSFSDPSCGLNRYNNWVPQGCFPGSSELNRRLSRTADCRVQSNVWCEPEPRQGVGILGVFAALAGIAVVATALRKPSEDITIVEHTKKSVATTPKLVDPVVVEPTEDKKDPIVKPTLTKPAATASREDKHAWLTAKNVDHKYGHLNYAAYELAMADATDVTLADGTTKAKLHKDAAAAFTKMQADAKAAGIDLQLNSAYRDKAQQETEFLAEGGYSNPSDVAKKVAPAGYSEHCTGYAVDFDLSPSGVYDKKTDDWIKANAATYGFVNPFTKGNVQGVNAEAWHWRFEGNAAYPDKSGGAAKAFKAAHDLEKLK